MSGLRGWILVLAATCFAAGLGAGVLLGEARAAGRRPAPVAGDPCAVYRALFEESFPLSAERRQLLEQLLARYEEELSDLRQQALAASISQRSGELAQLGLRYRDHIRNHVLPPEQRARFDQLETESLEPPARR